MQRDSTKQTSSTLLEAIRESIAGAARHDPNDSLAPVAILWPDEDRQWSELIPQLRILLPQLITLGQYDLARKAGPGIWIRCVIERVLPGEDLPEEAVPIVYVPGVSRQMLRAIEDCPYEVQPLVELQYRGTVWTQRNGRDWTVEAFLVSKEGGLGLDLARDKYTRRAMLGALKQLAATPLSRLRGKRLEAEDFDKLMIEDTPRDLLTWLNDPVSTREEWDEGKWAAFRSRCKAEYRFDPEKDGELVGGERLGSREDAWSLVWQRFTESPGLYPSIADLLRRAKPSTLIFDREPWPDENAKDEDVLRKCLLELGSMNAAAARQKIEDLETEHALRRKWVWAQIGQSPLAESLAHLTELARKTSVALGGDTLKAVLDVYNKGGYLADDAALKAMSTVKRLEDTEAIQVAVRTMYLPWLEEAARHFQEQVSTAQDSADIPYTGILIAPEDGETLLFVDGLRFDIALRLVTKAEGENLEANIHTRWAALPTVTATAKPAVTPISDMLSGGLPGEDFSPYVVDGDLQLTPARFKKLLTEKGVLQFDVSELGNPHGHESRGWTEFGQLDKLGHALQSKLAYRIEEQLDLCLERIICLLEAGWKSVRVVTDHGWLLVPGGLPDVPLPKYLTQSRWARCASIKPGAHVEVPTARWHWNSQELFAYAPGVHCFTKGHEYAHGGISIQECLIPELVFTLKSSTAPLTVALTDLKWVGMRCRVSLEATDANLTADLRTKPNDPDSSITTAKQIDADGRVALLVADDSLEGSVISLVIVDSSGRVIRKEMTTVGGGD